MAANGLAIVSVEQFKAAIRQDGSDMPLDDVIAGNINGAAEWIEGLCKMGIVDGPGRVVLTASAPDAPLRVRHRSTAIRDAAYRKAGSTDDAVRLDAAIIVHARDTFDLKGEFGASGGVGSGRPWAVWPLIQPYRVL